MGNKSAHFGALRLLVVIAIFAASLRALVPIGYMASLEGGHLAIVPCSGVLEIASSIHVPTGSEHHSHHGGAAPAHQDEKSPHNQHRDLANCPFAGGCCASLTLAQIDLAISFISSPALLRKLVAPLAEPHAKPFSARGPPSFF